MGKASRKQKKTRAAQDQTVRHDQNEAVKSAPVEKVQEYRPSQWRQVVEEMAAAEKRAAAARSAPAEPPRPVKAAKLAKPDKTARPDRAAKLARSVETVKAEGKARAAALLARAREKAGPAARSALSAAESVWEKTCDLTGEGWDVCV